VRRETREGEGEGEGRSEDPRLRIGLVEAKGWAWRAPRFEDSSWAWLRGVAELDESQPVESDG